MCTNWRRIVIVACVFAIVFSGIWIVRIVTANRAAGNLYEQLENLIGSSAKAEEMTAPRETTAVPPTFEQWLARQEEDRTAVSASAGENGEVAAGSDAAVEPVTEEEMADAEARAADEDAAAGKYAEMLHYAKGMSADTWDAILHMLYYQWLSENGYEVPEEAEQVEQSLLMDFSALEAVNPDVVGWLLSEGTVINYPIAHRADDNDYYLHHLFDGTRNAAGTLFTDMYNDKGFTDQNTIMYGHHMRNDTMFGTIVGYKEQSYYDEHPSMLLYTPGATYLVELFAGYMVQIGDGDHPCFQMVFADADSYAQFIEDAKEKSTFSTGLVLDAEDRIVTLSTCTYEVYNARYVVHGKLTLVAGETPEPEEEVFEEDEIME